MRIAILSDSHDQIWNLAKAMPGLKTAQVVLHCGDIISPFMIVRLGEGLPGVPIHIVWGNNDGDKRLLTQMAARTGHILIHGDFAELELDGLRFAMTHYPEIARPLALTGQYDVVCYGHDHTRHEARHRDTLLVNPGELMGLKSQPSFVYFDSITRQVEWVFLD